MLGNRKKEKILANYSDVKRTTFDFERIAQLFIHKDKTNVHQVIPYNTLQDLDFEELFMYMDRTCSKIGQQYLYFMLRTIPKNDNRLLRNEKIIKYLDENVEVKESIVLEISRLDEPGSYFIYGLGYNQNIVKPKWFWLIPLLSSLSITTLVLSLIFSVFVLVFIPILVANFIIHYWNKKNVLVYSNSIPQLIILNQVAHKLIRSGVILDDFDRVQKSNNIITKISKSAILFKMESKLNSELGQVVDYLLDLIKASFLLEPILVFKIDKMLELRKTEIREVFDAVAKVDVALSISSFRKALPFYVIPEITENKKSFYGDEIYHPLLLKPVSNTIDLTDGKSVLISGSNMSGKTTFIRAIGINAILSQTINTACAKNFKMPRLKVHSAIKINDNLLDDSSYYYEEVKTIKKMITESHSDHQNLFLLDELFKGTNTVERISSGKAVLSYLNLNENIVFVSTHDIELIELLNKSYKYFHFAESIKDDLLSFDYKLKGGKLTNTNAIRILEINGFPEVITSEAKALSEKIKRFKG